MPTNTLSESEIREVLSATETRLSAEEAHAATGENDVTVVRRILVIGCGDGGCNISSMIASRIPENLYTIAYNTSRRKLDSAVANGKIFITDEHGRDMDGSGKSREYSKTIFKDKTYEKVLKYVGDAIDEFGAVDYILITTTTDGGTGSGMSVVLAKLLMDNFGLNVIMAGVYPMMADDAQAQYNAMSWQKEVVKIGVPYIILDNNVPAQRTTKLEDIYEEVNTQAADAAVILAGSDYSNAATTMIDNCNMSRLTHQLGGRIVAVMGKDRPTAGQSLDDYVEDLLSRSCQPAPHDATGIGVWVKGPADLLASMDVSLTKIQKKYGQVTLKFAHTEESKEIEICIIFTGCGEVTDRLEAMKHRYTDIMNAQTAKTSVIDDLLEDMVDPMGSTKRGTTTQKKDDGLDTSALDL